MGKLERFIVDNVDLILCNSSFTYSNVMKVSHPRNQKIVPPGIDVHMYSPMDKRACRSALLPGVNPDVPVIFSLGRLIDLKGHRYLIDAMAMLKHDPAPHLVIGGDGPLRKQLELYAMDRGLSGMVTFTGTIPKGLTPQWHSAADVYVQPSVVDREGNTEGLGLTVAEALACETPSIGSKVGGIPDMIKDSITGYLVEPANPVQLVDRISLMINDTDLRSKLGKKGRRFVEDNYSWNVITKRMKAIYSSLIH